MTTKGHVVTCEVCHAGIVCYERTVFDVKWGRCGNCGLKQSMRWPQDVVVLPAAENTSPDSPPIVTNGQGRDATDARDSGTGCLLAVVVGLTLVVGALTIIGAAHVFNSLTQ